MCFFLSFSAVMICIMDFFQLLFLSSLLLSACVCRLSEEVYFFCCDNLYYGFFKFLYFYFFIQFIIISLNALDSVLFQSNVLLLAS